jgi:hypothetical protein
LFHGILLTLQGHVYKACDVIAPWQNNR